MLPQKIIMTLKKILNLNTDIDEMHNIKITHKKKITLPIPYKCMFS